MPIHPKINGIIEKRYEENNEFLFSDYNMFEQEICGLSYDKYRGRFGKVMKALKMIHTPHETRHTFITKAKYCHVDDYMLKRIIGHEISDITEKIYTHRNLEELKREIVKVIF